MNIFDETMPPPEHHKNEPSNLDWFDAQWYLTQNAHAGNSHHDAAFHYLHTGIFSHSAPNRYALPDFTPTIDQLQDLLRNCIWFDPRWYLQQYPDVAAAGLDATDHYLNHGIHESRHPNRACLEEASKQPPDDLLLMLKKSEWFDADWYLQQYPDVAEAGIDAAHHYLYFGSQEQRQPGPLFDEGYYLSQIAEPLNQASGLLHFLIEGEKSGFKPVRDWDDTPWWWQRTLPFLPVITLQTLEQLRSEPLPIVVVPVFNAVNELADCLLSLKEHRKGISKVIIIDDASTDPAIPELLSLYQHDSFFECYRNEQNLGFSGTVNRGITLASDSDIILLNSDTKVTRGFAQRLRFTAYNNTKVATVTPLSNNAGVFSVPSPGNSKVPAQFGLTQFALAITQAAVSAPITVPTGHGFCMFIRRAALNDAGLFDAEAFPRGYGEENDFCRRSAALGWQHLIDPRTYIFHHGAASFSTEKQTLIASGLAVLEQRYPDYPAQISECFSSDAIKRLRQQITSLAKMPLQNAQQIKPRALYVISTLMGGTPQTNQDLMSALVNDYECFVLHCDSEMLTLRHFIGGVYTNIAEYKLSTPIKALPHTSDEYDQVVASWLIEWSIDLVHIRHLAWHSLGLVSVAKALGVALIHSFHDFYTLCPTVKLLDNNQEYCAAICTTGSGRCAHELWPDNSFFNLKHNQIHEWQRIFAKTLHDCDAFVTTDPSAKELFLTRYPMLAERPFNVISHGRDFSYFENLAAKPEPDQKLRILCPGNIGEAKGLRLIQQLALNKPDIEIHILGIITYDLPLPDNVKIHGPYIREQFSARVAQIRPHFGAILSIWPETWCHTLTEMWAAGIPVIGIDIGAVGERIRQSQAGWLVPDSTTASLENVIDTIISPDEWESKFQAVKTWQSNEGEVQTTYKMASLYARLYNAVIGAI